MSGDSKMKKPIICIPDIHGEADKLESVLSNAYNKWGPYEDWENLIFLGDMIDRGPKSNAVINMVRSLQEGLLNVVVLAGNHEWLCIDALTKQTADDVWLWKANGGGDKYDDETVKWMAALPLKYAMDGFFFSHAPLPLGAKEPYSKEQLIWTYEGAFRYDPVTCMSWPDKVGVCGHIHAIREGILEPRFDPEYYFLDAGCGCFSGSPLVAVNVRDKEWVRSE